MSYRIAFVLILVTAANAVELPDSPSKTIDAKFLAVLSTEAVAKSADFAETAAHLGNRRWVPCVPAYTCMNHGSWFSVQENDPWFGRRPGTMRLVTENAGLFGAESFLAYEIKKPHRWLPGDKVVSKLWWLPIAYQIQAHARFAYRNSRL
jgi:hypothetical protein